MIENQDFIVFSDDWGRHPSSCQHIFKRLAGKNRVLWVNTIGMRLPSLGNQDFKRSLEKVVSWVRPKVSNNGSIMVYSPIMTPFYNLRLFRKLNDFLLTRGIKRQLKKYKMKSPVLVTTVPNVSGLVGRLGERKSIYYCVDEFSKWPGMLKDTLSKMEGELLERVDLILATAEKLRRNKTSSRCPSYLLSHGVDVEHFKRSSQEEMGIPAEMQMIKKPIIGYFGLFDERMDLEILRYIACCHPEWSIVILGKIAVNTNGLRNSPNIHFLGPVDYDVIPNYARAFDVCILPYLVNDLTANINPLKLREYLATGKPIVTTRLPEVERYRSLLEIVDSQQEFVRAVEVCLKDRSIEMVRRRQEAVSDESWEAKAEEFSRRLSKIAERKINVMHLRSVCGCGGGPEKTILLSGERIDKKRFEMRAVYLKDARDSDSNIREKAEQNNLAFYEVLERGRIDWQAIKQVKGLIEKHRIDILHCHDYKSDILGLFLARLYPLKLVTTVHGWIERDIKERLYIWLDKRILKFFDRVICVSEVMRQYLLSIGIPSEKLAMIHNAIDTEDFKNNGQVEDIRREFSIPKDAPIIAAIGRLSKEKDLPSLFKVVAKVIALIPEAKFLIVGDGPLRRSLELAVLRQGLEKNVIFLGQRRDILKIYKRLDLVVSTSVTEGLPNTVLEAQAMEVPVIATDVGGIREIIEDDVNGLLYQPKDVEGIARGIVELLSDKNKALRFAQEGRKRICREFSFDERMRKVEQVYLEIASSA